MNWLLKIVDGPMKGAEIALVGGMCVTVGRDEGCDIVVADQSLGETAFKLDVSESGVTLLGPGDVVTPLNPFEIHAFGTSAFAVGPAQGEWEELRQPVAPAAEPAAASADESAAPSGEEQAAPSGEGPVSASADESAPPSGEGTTGAEAEDAASPRRRRTWLWLSLLLLLLLLAPAVLAWFFWPKIVERYPRAEEVRVACVGRVQSWISREAKNGTSVVPRLTLADIAAAHGLTLTNYPLSSTNSPLSSTNYPLPSTNYPLSSTLYPLSSTNSPLSSTNYPLPSTLYPLLKGNLKRRTERLAIRALALAAEPTVRLDLTDDESLLSSANALLYVVTDGAVKATVATNRVLKLEGEVASPEEFSRIMEALKADVPGFESVDVGSFTVADAKPVEKIVVVEKIKAPEAPVAPSVSPSPTPQPSPAPTVEPTKPTVALTKPTVEPTKPMVAPTKPTVAKKKPLQPNLPIAGILTVPYPCIVLSGGQRILEGAQFGGFVVEKIEAEKITLKMGERKVEWRP